MTEQAWIGLGSNLDEPIEQVKLALEALAALPDSTLEAVSSLYRSSPMGPQDQPDYINAVACLRTGIEPMPLLRELQAIEQKQNRRRGRHWGPRTLDLDLLVYGQMRINDLELVVPHPGIAEREFVLHPLAEIAPDLDIPGLPSLAMMLSVCPLNDLQRLDND